MAPDRPLADWSGISNGYKLQVAKQIWGGFSMPGIDPLAGNVEQLQASLTQSAVASMANGVASIEVGPDGSLRAIRLTAHGRRLDPDTLVDAIIRLHAAAFAEARQSVRDAVARLERDPRLLATREGMMDALSQPLPQAFSEKSTWPGPAHQSQVAAQAQPGSTSGQQAPVSRQPTQEEEEEMDRYYQHKSWLEY
jgi:hypothetical protein